MAEISLVSVNIERSKHLDLVIPFLKKHQPEVATIQECMERDIPLLEDTLGAKCFYTPLCFHVQRPDEDEGLYGQAILSRYPLVGSTYEYYAGEYDPIPNFGEDKASEIDKVARALSMVEFEKDGTRFRVATTHFTWTEGGLATDKQMNDLEALLKILKDKGEFVLTGDFNAPRGRAAWEKLAGIYKDNIPAHYTSSIDPVIHRAAPLPYVVDGIFTTPHYSASRVELHEGVSDHKAVTATVARV